MAADYKLNQLFAKYGHECNIENELDETPNFFPGKTCYARVQRTLMRFRMISETNKRCNRYLRSQGAIAFEKYRHLKQNSYMIHPFSDARKYIECFMCLIFLIQFVMVPLDIAYFGKPPSSTDLYTSAPWKTVRLLTDCFCFTDVWLNYLTGYFNEHKKQSEMSPKKFAKYGHECNIENELDETPNFFPGKTCYARVQRTLMRFRMISETNKRCNRYLRSQGAIAFEKYRHLKQNSYMIHPFSDARKYIECFMCLIFLIQFVMVPLDIAYFGKPPSSTDLYTSAPWKTVRLLTDCFCFTDVWLNYLTGYFNEHKKQSEMSPKKVALYASYKSLQKT
ncbi:hypothetical protein FQR65_LT11637 [Abscondita terminalis]|nr:hypothetical protein FQR65_LT11637 [Abscondita terminalis]